MGRHTLDGTVVAEASHNVPAPKPGSRRALREAERAAKLAQTTAEFRAEAKIAQNKDTGEIPVVTSDSVVTTPASAFYKPTQPMRRTSMFGTFAEKMNHELVVRHSGDVDFSQVQVSRRAKWMQGVGFAAAALVIVGTGVGFSVDPASSHLINTASAATLTKAETSSLLGDSATETADSATAQTARFSVTLDGKTREYEATAGVTLVEALRANGVVVDQDDEITPALNTALVDGLTVNVVRVETRSLTEDFTVKYATKKVDDDSLEKGEEEVETEGKNGSGTRTYNVTYRDGKETSRELVVETVAEQPVDEVIHVGTKEENSLSSLAEVAASTSPVPAGSARAIAQQMVADRGWAASEFACLDQLWQRESNWRHTAMNPSSGAYGIPQALPGSKMASAGADWQTNPATQIKWGLGYISGRYGTPCGALSHSHSVGWY